MKKFLFFILMNFLFTNLYSQEYKIILNFKSKSIFLNGEEIKNNNLYFSIIEKNKKIYSIFYNKEKNKILITYVYDIKIHSDNSIWIKVIDKNGQKGSIIIYHISDNLYLIEYNMYGDKLRVYSYNNTYQINSF